MNTTASSSGLDTITPTRDDHDELRRLAASINLNCIALATMVAARQHDRQHPTTTGNAEDWCRHHLDTIGSCEPRHRGDLCKWCYEFQGEHRALPSQEILEVRHNGARVTTKMVAEFKRSQENAKRAEKRKKRKRRK